MLAGRYAAANPDEQRELRRAAYEIAGPIVFQRKTRSVEIARGHHACAVSLGWLEPDCLDRYHDDTQALVEHLLLKAWAPIVNLDGWLVARLNVATIDAHRRRRGERGALQKVRVPQWVLEGLAADRWLSLLAHEMLVWVGLPVTAGIELWPIDAWVDRRVGVTGDHRAGESAVRRDIETVLATMRRRPHWYAKYVERPLGRKEAPVRGARAGVEEPEIPERPLSLVARHYREESRLHSLAGLALDAIVRRVERGEDPRTVVAEVVRVAFGGSAGGDDLELGLAPGESSLTRLAAELLGDEATVDRVVGAVLGLLPTF
ncbi:hypothetical protein ACQP2P_04985 [Dactylosporangium sp. CA-139114]|uniref:hypothetical protein n=1 Tax=Dactylosporangium sp. CA-139114 TaxID=3239931 RepID=UPI003D97D822